MDISCMQECEDTYEQIHVSTTHVCVSHITKSLNLFSEVSSVLSSLARDRTSSKRWFSRIATLQNAMEHATKMANQNTGHVRNVAVRAHDLELSIIGILLGALCSVGNHAHVLSSGSLSAGILGFFFSSSQRF